MSRKNIPAKILNLALHEEDEIDEVLKRYLELFQPTHAGVILHWQETCESFIRVGEILKSLNNDISIISGGFTAGYFGESLLERYPFLDFIVKGDPEKPLELLLSGADPSHVPNIIYRAHSGVRSNQVSYFIDRGTLSSIRFSELTYLYDYESYVGAINKKLGFPVFIGRGCVYSCRYCGGSSPAFRSHSERVKPVTRSIKAIIADLKRLKEFTRKIYLCYENDRDYIKALFNAMKKEEKLIKAFHLNYGAWKLPDEEFLELYKELFVRVGDIKPVLELSPEVFDDKGRKRIRKGRVYFSTEQLKDSLKLIYCHLGGGVNVSVFFSRYHETTKTYTDIKREIAGIFGFKHYLCCENLRNVRVFYDHLSTDAASRYWEDYVKQPKDFDTLRSAIQKVKVREQHNFPVDNLCIYIPKTLKEDEIFRCESLIFILKTLEKSFYEMFHITFKCLAHSMIDIFEDFISESNTNKPHNVFTSFDHHKILDFLRQKITGDETMLERIPFITDLVALNMKKARLQECTRDVACPPYTGKPKLNQELISINDHDYLDLRRFMKRLDDEGVRDLRAKKTANLFLSDEILSMSLETFDLTLKEFEKGISVDEYCALMKKKGIFTPSYHEGLINKLLLSNVLG